MVWSVQEDECRGSSAWWSMYRHEHDEEEWDKHTQEVWQQKLITTPESALDQEY